MTIGDPHLRRIRVCRGELPLARQCFLAPAQLVEDPGADRLQADVGAFAYQFLDQRDRFVWFLLLAEDRGEVAAGIEIIRALGDRAAQEVFRLPQRAQPHRHEPQLCHPLRLVLVLAKMRDQ